MADGYELIHHSVGGFPFTEVYAEYYTFGLLHRLTGFHGYQTTFYFKEGTEAHKVYGPDVTGVMYYDYGVQKTIDTGIDLDAVQYVRIFKSASSSPEHRSALKLAGVKVADIKHISFLTLHHEKELFENGEKKIPNVVEIPVQGTNADAVHIKIAYLLRKFKDGIELVQFEKETLLGMLMARDDRVLDHKLVATLGFTSETIATDLNIAYHYYKTKAMLGTATHAEKEQLEFRRQDKEHQIMETLERELRKSGMSKPEIFEASQELDELLTAAKIFEGRVLLHTKKQVYLDVERYVHIAFGHFKAYQKGTAKIKSALPYKPDDLEDLIQRILQEVAPEYKAHCLFKPTAPFCRRGDASIPFNGDYYTIRISPDGKIMQFHNRGCQAIKNAE